MTNEERKVIDNIKAFIRSIRSDLVEESEDNQELANDLDTVLSLIKENQKQLEKKDKQIDLMARAIDNYDSQLEINTFKDKEHIKQYFADLVEKE